MTEKINPLLIIISGPSAVGKDAVINGMKKKGLPFYYSITATSRPKRPGEIDGVDYHFIERAEFEKMIGNGDFLEWANVYGNLYGVPKKTTKEAMAAGKDAIVKVDIQGAAIIKKLEPNAVAIFITPPSMEELERRLVEQEKQRGKTGKKKVARLTPKRAKNKVLRIPRKSSRKINPLRFIRLIYFKLRQIK